MLIWTATAMKWIRRLRRGDDPLGGHTADRLITEAGSASGCAKKAAAHLSGIIAAVAGVWILLTQALRKQVMLPGHCDGRCAALPRPHGLQARAGYQSCGSRRGRRRLCWACASIAAGVLLLMNPFEKERFCFAAALGFLLDGISGLFSPPCAVAHGKSRAEFLAGQSAP